MMRTPELAVEVSLQPLQRFSLDAAILFCDILVVLEAMGFDVRYEKGGPKIEPLVTDMASLGRIQKVSASDSLGYVAEAVGRLCQKLHPEKAVIGFAGAPFTLAAYLLTGGPARQINHLKTIAYRQPDLFRMVLDKISDVVADLLLLQIEAGADMVQLFDTWAWHLAPDDYIEWALPYTQKVIARVASTQVPVSLYLRNAAGHLEAAASSGCQVLSVDGSISLVAAAKRLDRVGQGHLVLQGNFDPALLTADSELIRQKVCSTLDAMRGKAYIVNLGQGLVPDSPIEGVQAFVQAVQQWNG
jgi:uroporphyrinogen decarboxylase